MHRMIFPIDGPPDPTQFRVTVPNQDAVRFIVISHHPGSKRLTIELCRLHTGGIADIHWTIWQN